VRIGPYVALLSLVLTLASCGGDDRAKNGSAAARENTARIHVGEGPFLGFLWPPGGVGEIQLAELDPRTLAPKSRPLTLEAQGGVTELSPDGRTLALAAGEAPQIEILDLERMRSLGTVDLGMAGYVSRLSWSSGMLFAAVGQSDVALVHPGARQLVEMRQVDGLFVGDIQAIPAGMLALVGPSEGIGQLEAVVFGGKGTSSVPLRGIVGGSKTETGDDEADFRVTENIPGLAVDPSGRRALVVPAGGQVAKLSLDNLRVTYHSLSQSVSLLERLRNWLEPTAQAKVIEGPIRQAVWLPSGLVAVTGADYTVSDENEVIPDPAGLSLIDTSDWSVRMINDRVDGMLLAGERLLAFEPWCAGDRDSFGFATYDLEGTEIFRVCRDEGFDPQVVGDYVYLGFDDNTRFEVVDLRTGQVVAELSTTKTTSLLTN
jgi:hypothetical protein